MTNKKWKVVFTNQAIKEFSKLGPQAQKRVEKFIDNKLLKHDDPKIFGKLLTGPLVGDWSFRVGDYRMICEVHDHILTIYTVHIGHRREVYQKATVH